MSKWLHNAEKALYLQPEVPITDTTNFRYIRRAVSLTGQSGGVQVLKFPIAEVESLAPDFTRIAAVYSSVRVEWLKMTYIPDPGFLKDPSVSLSPIYMTTFHDPIPQAFTIAPFFNMLSTVFHCSASERPACVKWVRNPSAPLENGFYPVSEALMTEELGGLTICCNGNIPLNYLIGTVELVYKLQVRDIKN